MHKERPTDAQGADAQGKTYRCTGRRAYTCVTCTKALLAVRRPGMQAAPPQARRARATHARNTGDPPDPFISGQQKFQRTSHPYCLPPALCEGQSYRRCTLLHASATAQCLAPHQQCTTPPQHSAEHPTSSAPHRHSQGKAQCFTHSHRRPEASCTKSNTTLHVHP